MRRKQIGAAAVFLIALIFLGVNIAAVADDLVGEARSLSVLSVSGDEAVVMRGANREIKAAADARRYTKTEPKAKKETPRCEP